MKTIFFGTKTLPSCHYIDQKVIWLLKKAFWAKNRKFEPNKLNFVMIFGVFHLWDNFAVGNFKNQKIFFSLQSIAFALYPP